MLPIPGLPIIVRPRQTCPRCGLKYKKRLDQCPHCAHLQSDEALQALKNRHQQQLEGNRSLGLLFLIIAVIGITLVVAASADPYL